MLPECTRRAGQSLTIIYLHVCTEPAIAEDAIWEAYDGSAELYEADQAVGSQIRTGVANDDHSRVGDVIRAETRMYIAQARYQARGER
jgi:hypothetical protein